MAPALQRSYRSGPMLLRKILLVVLTLLALAMLVGLVLPTVWVVERSTLINVPAARVHELVGDLRRWPEWTTWSEVSSGLQIQYGRTTSGTGASQSWTDDDGAGRLVYTRCDAAGVAYDMAFIDDGKEMPAKGEIRYDAAGEATTVTWTMTGDLQVPVVGGWVRLMMLEYVEDDLDRSLAKLKRVAEAR